MENREEEQEKEHLNVMMKVTITVLILMAFVTGCSSTGHRLSKERMQWMMGK